MWMPPDRGNEYIAEQERKLEEEARLREARTGRPNEFLKSRRNRMRPGLLESFLSFLVVGVLLIVLFVIYDL